jgi:hypothetical protein
MAKGTKNDYFQIAILVSFMVSALLLLFNLWYSRERQAAFAQAQAAVEEFNKLKVELKNPRLLQAIAIGQQIEDAKKKGRRDLFTEINARLAGELPGVKESPKLTARLDASGMYRKHVYQLESGRSGREKVMKPLDVWLGFLGRIEADRPDIHVESLSLDTDTMELAGGEKRNWRCDARLVLFEPIPQKTAEKTGP